MKWKERREIALEKKKNSRDKNFKKYHLQQKRGETEKYWENRE